MLMFLSTRLEYYVLGVLTVLPRHPFLLKPRFCCHRFFCRRFCCCGVVRSSRRHFQTAPPAPRPSPQQSLPSEVPPGTLPSDHDSIFPGVTPSHASLQKPSIAGGAQLSTPLPPPPGFQADSRASSTVAVTPQTKAMAASVGSSRAKQPPASTNGRLNVGPRCMCWIRSCPSGGPCHFVFVELVFFVTPWCIVAITFVVGQSAA